MNAENVTSFLATVGDWRRLQRMMRMTPAEIQKRSDRVDLFLGLGMVLGPFSDVFYHDFLRKLRKTGERVRRRDGSPPLLEFPFPCCKPRKTGKIDEPAPYVSRRVGMTLQKTRGFGRPVRFGVCAAVVLCLLAPLSFDGLAGPRGPAQEKVLRHETGVALKLVQAYATTKDGKPVTDLTPGDFVVTDNGKAVKVGHFEKHMFAGPAERGEAVPGSPILNRKTFLLFDFAFMDQRGVYKSKVAGLHYLDTQVQPSDEVGLLSYSASRGLTLHEYFTTDHEKVRKILDGFGLKHVSGRAERLTDFIYDISVTESAQLGRTEDQLSPEEQFFIEQARLQTGYQPDQGRRETYIGQARHLLVTLRNLATVLRTVPGYKNIIFFSNGIARQILFGKTGGAVFEAWSNPDELAQQLQEYDSAQSDAGLQSEFTALLKEFKASNCPVFAMDTSRLQGDFAFDTPDGTAPSTKEFAGDDFLRQFAGQTGGEFFAKTVDYKDAMEKIQNTTGAYYVLGYTIDPKWDGKFHKVKVKVNRKGVKLLAQGGYFNPKLFKDLSSFEKLLHIIDLALGDNPQIEVPAEVPLEAHPVLLKGWPNLVSFTRVPKDLAEDVIGKRAEAYLLLFNGSGDLVDIKWFPLKLSGEEKEGYIPGFVFPIQPGQYSCRIVIRNRDTGAGARGLVSLKIPETGASVLHLDPPLLLRPSANSMELGAAPEAMLSSVYAFDAASYEPYCGEVPRGTGTLTAVLRCTSGAASADFDFTASLMETESATRTDIPVSVISRTEDGSTKQFLVELSSGELGPGTYELSVVVQPKDGSQGAYSTVRFKVR
jgi:VWFA-related protein